MAPTRLSWYGLSSQVTFAVVIKFNPNKKMLEWKFLKIFMCIFWTNLPAINFKLVAVTNESRVEGDSKYL